MAARTFPQPSFLAIERLLALGLTVRRLAARCHAIRFCNATVSFWGSALATLSCNPVSRPHSKLGGLNDRRTGTKAPVSYHR